MTTPCRCTNSHRTTSSPAAEPADPQNQHGIIGGVADQPRRTNARSQARYDEARAVVAQLKAAATPARNNRSR